jgi:hypothetical protein
MVGDGLSNPSGDDLGDGWWHWPPHLQEGFGNFALLNCDVSIQQAALQELLQRKGKISGMIV